MHTTFLGGGVGQGLSFHQAFEEADEPTEVRGTDCSKELDVKFT